MRKILLLLTITLLFSCIAGAQILKSPPLPVVGTNPATAPSASGAEVRVDTFNRLFLWNRSTQSWTYAGVWMQETLGAIPPAYTPSYALSPFTINDVDSMYRYRAGSWRHLNPPGGSGTVNHGATLTGDGSIGTPLDVATSGITATQLANNAVTTNKILNSAVTYAKMPVVAASRLIGNSSLTTPGTMTEISLGTGLSFSGSALQVADQSATNEIQTLASTSDATSHTVTLSGPNGSLQLAEGSGITLATTGTSSDGIVTITATGGGGGTPGGSDTQMQYNNAGAFGGTSGLDWINATKTLQFSTPANLSAYETDLDFTGTYTSGSRGLLRSMPPTGDSRSKIFSIDRHAIYPHGPGTMPNEVVTWGFNTSHRDVTKSAWYWAMEPHYDAGNGGDEWMEIWLEAVHPVSAVHRRMLFGTFKKGATMAASIMEWNWAGSHSFETVAGATFAGLSPSNFSLSDGAALTARLSINTASSYAEFNPYVSTFTDGLYMNSWVSVKLPGMTLTDGQLSFTNAAGGTLSNNDVTKPIMFNTQLGLQVGGSSGEQRLISAQHGVNIRAYISTNFGTAEHKHWVQGGYFQTFHANNAEVLRLQSAVATVTGALAVTTTGNFTGKVAIGTASAADASAILDVVSTTSAFYPPRMTSAQRDAITGVDPGGTVYCTDCTATDASTGVMQTWNGSAWKNNW